MTNEILYDVRPIVNLKDMLEQSCSIFSKEIAFKFKQKQNSKTEHCSISYEQFKFDVDCLGTALLSKNLKDKKIAVISENRYEWAVSYLATVNGTGIVVPIDRALPDNEIENIVQSSEVSSIIYSSKFESLMQNLSDKYLFIECLIPMDGKNESNSFVSLIEQGKRLLSKGDKSFTDAQINNEAMSMLLYTSGTSDLPKAVMLSHKNICSNMMSICKMFKATPKDVFLSFLPLHHTYECTCGFLCAIYSGSSIAFCEGLKHIVNNFKEFQATIMCSVPLLYENMHKKIWEQAAKKRGTVTIMKIAIAVSNFLRKFKIDFTKKIFSKFYGTFGSGIRVFLSGASGINPKVAKGFRDFGITFIQGYGLTECSPLVAGNNVVNFKDDAGGLPYPDVEIRIDNPNENGIGEIVTKGPNVMIGYYKNQELTDKVLKDGWFYTGDLGFIDKDGFVHICGRKKNVIVMKNGKNVYPEEIEEKINGIDFVKESMVWGQDNPDSEVTINASIVLDDDAIEMKFSSKPDKETLKALIDAEIKKINKTLPLYKYIREFNIKDNDFVKTTTQKIKRYLEKIEKK